jgi:hypothetical protein
MLLAAVRDGYEAMNLEHTRATRIVEMRPALAAAMTVLSGVVAQAERNETLKAENAALTAQVAVARTAHDRDLADMRRVADGVQRDLDAQIRAKQDQHAAVSAALDDKLRALKETEDKFDTLRAQLTRA